MNSLSIDQAVKTAAKSFDWVLKNKNLLIALAIGVLVIIAGSFLKLSYYPNISLVHSSTSLFLSGIAGAFIGALVMLYAKNQFDGKGSSLVVSAQQLIQRLFQIAPAIILIAGLDTISSSSMATQWGMIPSLAVKAASFVLYTLALYLLSITVNHHGSFISAVRHWLNRIPNVAPAALVGRIMFWIFVSLIGLVAFALGALIIQIQSWLIPSLISTTLNVVTAFFVSIITGVVFAAQSYFFAALGWFSVHNKLPEQIEKSL